MATPTLLHVTQVAPYRDGPAGVHGVLDQSATAVAQLAESAGLGGRTGDRRPLPRARASWPRPGSWPCSPSARRRGRRPSATVLLDGVRSGSHLGAWPSTRPPTPATDGTSTGGWSAPASPAIPGPGRAPSTWSTPAIPPWPTSGPTWTWHDEVYTFRDLRPDARVLLAARPAELEPDADAPRDPAPAGYPALVVLHRRGGAGLLDLARALPPRLGEPGLPPPPGRRARLGPGRRTQTGDRSDDRAGIDSAAVTHPVDRVTRATTTASHAADRDGRRRPSPPSAARSVAATTVPVTPSRAAPSSTGRPGR